MKADTLAGMHEIAAAKASNRVLYTSLGERAKWFVDRVLRRGSKYVPALGRMGPVGSVRLREMEGPLYVRLGTTDWVVLEEIYRWGSYEPLLKHSLGNVSTVVDLGANVGLSVRLWQQMFAGAKVVAVEPEPANAKMLHRNVDAGPAPKSVAVVEACVAGSNRKVSLDTSNGNWGVRMKEGEGARAMTMPDVLRAGGVGDGAEIDLLKCDIEGAEEEVFAECAGWIERVRWLMIELHPPYDKERLLADLAKNGGKFEVRHGKDWGGWQEMLLLEGVRRQ